MAYSVSIQREDFSVGDEYAQLSQDPRAGAIATFVGKVRDHNLGDHVLGMELEHYPGMTEAVLQNICQQAVERWSLFEIRLIHRIGRLAMGKQIVFVGVSSQHRNASFAACEFIMDILKTRAPFWKKEWTDTGDRWLEARETDDVAATRWK